MFGKKNKTEPDCLMRTRKTESGTGGGNVAATPGHTPSVPEKQKPGAGGRKATKALKLSGERSGVDAPREGTPQVPAKVDHEPGPRRRRRRHWPWLLVCLAAATGVYCRIQRGDCYVYLERADGLQSGTDVFWQDAPIGLVRSIRLEQGRYRVAVDFDAEHKGHMRYGIGAYVDRDGDDRGPARLEMRGGLDASLPYLALWGAEIPEIHRSRAPLSRAILGRADVPDKELVVIDVAMEVVDVDAADAESEPTVCPTYWDGVATDIQNPPRVRAAWNKARLFVQSATDVAGDYLSRNRENPEPQPDADDTTESSLWDTSDEPLWD
jgi:hypothetical protein